MLTDEGNAEPFSFKPVLEEQINLIVMMHCALAIIYGTLSLNIDIPWASSDTMFAFSFVSC